MIERMNWGEAYKLWKYGSYSFPETLSAPVAAEKIFVENIREGYYIDGFDWLPNKNVQERKKLIEKNPTQFLLFTKPANKGTIHTIELLMEAQNEEERAAVWIAATAKELSEYRGENGLGRYAYMLHMAACEYLNSRYYLWHHAMKRLVPEIMIPHTVLNHLVCKDAEPVMGLIQMNTMMVKSSWSILRYSSLKEE